MNFSSIEHHAYGRYCYALDTDTMNLGIKTGSDITEVWIVWGDPFDRDWRTQDAPWNSVRQQVSDCRRLPGSLWWNIKVSPPYKRLKYYFELHCGQEVWMLYEDGFYTPRQAQNLYYPMMFIFAWMNPADISTVPQWARNTVWYQIFPSRFSRGTNPACTEEVLPWADETVAVTNGDRYGGNLRGIIDRLPYLHDLGINGLYLNPVNKSSSQHKYNTEDYLTIDPQFGTNADMAELVQKAHSLGMKVMVDGVFNHCGWEHFAWQDVLANRENSRYRDWFMVNDFDFEEPGQNSRKSKFYTFSFVDNMPKLNTNNPQVRDYICGICLQWIREYDIDAIRLDVANEISHEFCRQLRREVLKEKSDLFICGEIWNDATPFLQGDQFDSVINYPLRSSIMNFAMDKSSGTTWLEEQVNQCLTTYCMQNTQVLVNQMDSHDVARIRFRAGDRNLARQMVALMFMMPGSPCLYYGTEILMDGDNDPDCRRCMPWKKIDSGLYMEELEFFRNLIAFRLENEGPINGTTDFVHEKDGTMENRLVRFRKSDGKKSFMCIFNFSGQDAEVSSGEFKELLFSHGVSKASGGWIVAPCGFGIFSEGSC
ncbi:MAG: glycoside hydrolase family 13 protein [Treponema sp.]|nr:glycoside hydrolase family 13 protein [Treponema sp.]